MDFRDRIRLYEKHYETIDEAELTYVKLINIGSQVIINRIQDFLQSRIVYYLMNLHIRPRSIYLSRVPLRPESLTNSTENHNIISTVKLAATPLSHFVVNRYPRRLAPV